MKLSLWPLAGLLTFAMCGAALAQAVVAAPVVIPWGDWLAAAQVQGCKDIIAACAKAKFADPRWTAYVLATAMWETGRHRINH